MDVDGAVKPNVTDGTISSAPSKNSVLESLRSRQSTGISASRCLIIDDVVVLTSPKLGPEETPSSYSRGDVLVNQSRLSTLVTA